MGETRRTGRDSRQDGHALRLMGHDTAWRACMQALSRLRFSVHNIRHSIATSFLASILRALRGCISAAARSLACAASTLFSFLPSHVLGSWERSSVVDNVKARWSILEEKGAEFKDYGLKWGPFTTFARGSGAQTLVPSPETASSQRRLARRMDGNRATVERNPQMVRTIIDRCLPNQAVRLS